MTETCPDDPELESFLLGQTPGGAAEALERHLSACPRCAAALQYVRVSDPLVDALRCPPAFDAAGVGRLVESLLPVLKRLRPAGQEHTTPYVSPGDTSVPTQGFGFLAPKQAEDELGRLGPYRVLRRLGGGGMGEVFVADEPRLQRRVALKVIKPELMQRPDARAYFLREAQAIARVEHENIVAIFQVDEDHGVPFLAMPLLHGESLEERLARAGGSLPLDEALRLGREVASGLAAAHRRGLVHRDIKPGNIFLSVGQGALAEDAAALRTDDPLPSVAPGRQPGGGPVRVKILDFGLARAVRADATEVAPGGSIAGTPAYMAPEQGRGQVVDHRADLFSFGCVLYRMVTGRPAFHGPDLTATLRSVAVDQPPSPRDLNPDVPPALARLIEQLLAKNPEDRPPSAQAIVENIEAIEAARRPKLSRRRWLLVSTTLTLAASGAGAWLARVALLAPAPPEEPGEVTFELEEPAVTLLIRRGEGEERVLDLRDTATHKLAPGNYRLRPQAVTLGRRLVPDTFEVKAAEAQRLRLRLVGERFSTGKAHDHPVLCVAATPKKGEVLIVSASIDGSVGVWAPFAKPPDDGVKFLTGPPGEVHAVAIAPDGFLVATGGGSRNPRLADWTIRLWDPRRREQVDQLPGHASFVQALAFAPDGKQLLSGARDGTVYLWDLPTHRKSAWEAHNGLGVHGVMFSADGSRALTGGGDKQAALWDVATGRVLKQLADHGKAVRGVAFGPGANEATTACDDGLIRTWQWETGEVRKLSGHDGGVRGVAVSPDGRRLLSGGEDGTVRLWDAATHKPLHVFESRGAAVNSVAFTADGRRAVSGGADRTVRLWELPD